MQRRYELPVSINDNDNIVDYDKVYFIRIDRSSLPGYVSLLHPFVTKIIIWNIDRK